MKLIVMVLLSFIILACSASKESTKNENEGASYNSYTRSASLSALTKSLINEIKKEKRNSGNKKTYIPSQKLFNEFKLIPIDNIYFVNARIRINKEMDSTVLEAVGVKILQNTGETWTVQIPIEMLKDVADFSGIDNIDIVVNEID